jgi:hypothetical protein
LVRPSPFVAGAFFTLAVGNRTELLLTAPFYLYLFWHGPVFVGQAPRLPEPGNRSGCPTMSGSSATGSDAPDGAAVRGKNFKRALRAIAPMVFDFLTLPVTLALLTAAYNFARFHSIFDFGYFHIPEVRGEPWYEHGLFSLHSIPWNVHTMLFEGFPDNPVYPFLTFPPFGCSIFLSSPFLFLTREGGMHKAVCGLHCTATFCALVPRESQVALVSLRHDPSVDVPFAYGNGRSVMSAEILLFAVSLTINATAMWLFFGPTKSALAKC